MEIAVYQEYEQTLLKITPALTPTQLEQLVNFARFLKTQVGSAELQQEESVAEIEADNAEWEAILATNKGQLLLERLAGDALGEYRAGKTRPLMFNDEGQIVPG